MRRFLPTFFVLILLLAGCTPSRETAVITERPAPQDTAQTVAAPADTALALTPFPANYDTVQTRRFDQGKMWTFDNPPVEYFEEEYGFSPDEDWFEEARLGALRFADYCSASFVSPRGLVLTNHHCARESITEVSREGENLLDEGFYASELSAEREVNDLVLEQLIAMEDVTERVTKGLDKLAEDQDRASSIQQRTTQIEERMTREAASRDSSLRVEVIELYDGARYSAYTFRQYEDVRLVMAPDRKAAFFGGASDNFTYPRYALDMSFFRVYGEDGEPLQTEHYFPWSEGGAWEGDVVFAVGNPGSTSRLNTVSQLKFERDVSLPQRLNVLQSRAEILQNYLDEHPEEAEEYDLRNTYFSVMNNIKSSEGQLEGLRDPELIARRVAAERRIQEGIAESDSLMQRYGDILSEMRAVQRSKEAVAAQSGAFAGFGNPMLSSHILTRALYGYIYSLSQQRGAPQSRLDELRKEALKVESWPAALEVQYIAARLRTLQDYLSSSDPTLRSLLQGRTPLARAKQIVSGTALSDSSQFAKLLGEGYMSSDDATVPFIKALAPLYFTMGRELSSFQAREERLEAQLAQARFALFGTDVPPDASFSLRIADGRVRGYEYNGTRAPAHTTFYGMYNHHYTYGPNSAWGLPSHWLSPPSAFEREDELNLVSTNDITGGNSGSPLLNRSLEIVGLVFDSNIEALPNEYLYRDGEARAISVDSRGMLEALDDIYDADRLVLELTEGEMVPTEAEAGEQDEESEES